jgi:hypothetical protein
MTSFNPPVKPPDRNGNGNGNGQTVRWVVGILGTALVGLVGGMLTTVKGNSERIAGLEQRLEALERQFDRINNKLDRLIERKEHEKP